MTPRARWLAVAGVTAIVGVICAVVLIRPHAAPVRATALGRLVTRDVTAPPNTRVRVEIINATKTRGLARRATRLLRDRGFDVVTFTTSDHAAGFDCRARPNEPPDWARLVGQALGGAQIVARPDTSRYVDVTVVLGTSWRPPPQPFSP